MSLILIHARYQLLETVRVPAAIIGTTFFPAAAMLFFVVPFAGDDPVAATYATGSMLTFAVMSACLFTHGIGVAEDRAQPWDPYVRTLPAGPLPRLAGRILSGLAVTGISTVPVLLIAAFLTTATATLPQILLGLGALAVTAVPFTLLGLLLGYTLPAKGAIAVAQVVFFPMAVGGGLLTDPAHPPAFIEAVAPYLPSRGGVELVWAAAAGHTPGTVPLVMLGVWIVGCAVAAAWAYRRDEGRRFS